MSGKHVRYVTQAYIAVQVFKKKNIIVCLVAAAARTGGSTSSRSTDGENHEMVVRLYSKLAWKMEQGSLAAKLFTKQLK